MKTPQPSRSLYAVLATLLVLLPLLAALQYRWIGEISQADRRRLEDTLSRLGSQFAEDFDREVIGVLANFQFRGAIDSVEMGPWIDRRLEESNRAYPGLVQRLFVAKPAGSAPELLRLDPQTHTLKTEDWPQELTNLRSELLSRADRFGERRQGPGPREFSVNGNPVIPVPVSGEPQPRTGEPGPNGPRGGPMPPQGWILVELKRTVFFDDFTAALVRRHFAAHTADYRIAIVSRGPHPQLVYKTDSEFPEADLASADLRIPLFFGGEQGRGRGPRGQPGGRPPNGPPLFQGPRGQPGAIPGLRGLSAAFGSWELVVKHRSGSLDAAITSVRRRNLAISFGILLMLAASVGLVVLSSHRARALAQLQMDFVARVSHELRTPLAVIRSAAYNMANGVVSGDNEIREYASMMQAEGQRLSTMVDQILTFSRTEAGAATYSIRPTRVEEIVDRVVSGMAGPLTHSGFEVQQNIAAYLPLVKADDRALTECLQNLLSNAMKYGRGNADMRIQIDARRADANTVLISVADWGPGIEPADLPHIFEPFFRGRNARSDTAGSGLGLNLVSRMMDAQGGRVTVESEPGTGARFTLHLTVVQEAAS